MFLSSASPLVIFIQLGGTTERLAYRELIPVEFLKSIHTFSFQLDVIDGKLQRPNGTGVTLIICLKFTF